MTVVRNRLRKKNGSAVTEGYIQQSDLIIQCARKCFEFKGVRRTTLTDIAHEANLTRELIYYYFSGKQEIVEEVLSQYIADAVETASLWCDCWEEEGVSADTPLPRAAIKDSISSIRRFVFGASGERRSMFSVLREIDRNQEVFSRACTEIIAALGDRNAVRRLHASFGSTSQALDPDKLEIMFKFVIMGVIGLMDSNRQYDDDAIADLMYNLGLKTSEDVAALDA